MTALWRRIVWLTHTLMLLIRGNTCVCMCVVYCINIAVNIQASRHCSKQECLSVKGHLPHSDFELEIVLTKYCLDLYNSFDKLKQVYLMCIKRNNLFPVCDLDLDPAIVILKCDPGMVSIYHNTNSKVSMPTSSKVLAWSDRHTNRHTDTANT